MKNKSLRKFLSALALPIGRLLSLTGILPPQIILKVDGGISSQMYFYLIGEHLRRRSGIPVSYDLIWFDEVGKDIDNKQIRNFDLLRLFPDLPLPKADNSWRTRLYRLLYTHEQDWNQPQESWENLCAPAYLTGYYQAEDALYSQIPKIFKPNPTDASEEDIALAEKISGINHAVGIHVRRGDLARYLPAYGNPASTGYFNKAIRLLIDKYGESTEFFIFSDDHQWVEKELMPALPPATYHPLKGNGADKGYIDLWLLSKCRHFIASAGSFGKFAALLNPGHGDVIIYDTPEARGWKNRIEGVTLIGD